MTSSAITPIEHALIARAYYIANGTTPAGLAVRPEFDCLTEAIHETCRHFGMGADEAARFMLSLACGLKRLRPDVEERLELRRVERQLHEALRMQEPGNEAD
jgi:hypothetical protein